MSPRIEEALRTGRLLGLLALRWLWRKQGLWLRALLCGAIGLTLVILDSDMRFDRRFRMRSAQTQLAPVTLIHLDQEDWLRLGGRDRNELRSLKEVAGVNDAFFWDAQLWQRLLKIILDGSPRAVGITLFFPPGTLTEPLNANAQSVFFDPRVVWAARLDNDGRALLPALTSPYGQNAGLIDALLDDDLVVRRFSSPLVQVPHMAARVAEIGQLMPASQTAMGPGRVINYRTQPGGFVNVSANQLFENPESVAGLLNGRIVLIGTRQIVGHAIATPVGIMSRAEWVAQLVDNFARERWIQRVPMLIVALLLAVLVVLAVIIVQAYPQAVAVVMLTWLGVAASSFSLWVFDQFNIWLPVLPSVMVLGLTYIIFLGYQLTQQEHLSWKLEQEKKYLEEIEQLKHNFVSLFSHDLKTPIAKIQAICDRLLARQPNEEIAQGLNSLRKESSELHRYIQSILRVSRIESSDFTIQREPTDINELIFRVQQQITPLADAKQIQIETELEPIFSIDADPSLMQEVILNLVENAIQYTPSGGRVVIASKEVHDQVIVSVQDNGPGIPPDEQGRVFEKFFRGSGHSLSTKGSGLGLFLVKYFVELHGGRVFIRSEPGKGTRIGFTLPVELTRTEGTDVYGLA